jgi:hypothetical protein
VRAIADELAVADRFTAWWEVQAYPFNPMCAMVGLPKANLL